MSPILRDAAPLAALLALYVAHALSLWRRLRAAQTEARLLRERIDEIFATGRDIQSGRFPGAQRRVGTSQSEVMG